MEERKTTLPSEEKIEVKLSECVIDDVPLLTDEKFDFNLSLSPTSEQEDEVFIGPVGHKEKCIATSLEACEVAEDKVPPPVEELTWSPLAGEKFVEIFKEAHLVALQLQSGSKKKKDSRRLNERKAEIMETFVQESKSKLKIFERGIDTVKTPSAVKRETYCVWESPVCQLPPSLQSHSQLPVAAMDNLHSPQIPINASNTPAMNKSTKIAVVAATQAHSAKTNTNIGRLQPMKTVTPRNDNHTTVEQAKQGRLPSTSSRNSLNSTGSSEDLLSDKSNTASRVGDSSFCSSSAVCVSRTLSTPSKGGIKLTQLKLPSNLRMRRDTTSSSSLSSMNSSLNTSWSISPQISKAAGVGPKASTNISRLSSGPTKISVVRPVRVSSLQASHSEVTGKQPTSATKGNSSVNAPKATLSANSSEPRLQKLLQKSILENRRSSTPTTKTVLPLSTKEVKNIGVSTKNATAKVLQPIGLLSSGNIGSKVAFSSPIKQLEDETMSNSCPVVKSTSWTPAKIKHSALPAPASRRLSGIPMTPKTLPRLMSSTNTMPARRISSVSSKKSLQTSSKWTKENKTRFTSSSSSSAEEDLSWPQVVPVALNFSPEKTPLEKEQDLIAEQKPEEETQVKEDILIDIEINKMPIVTQECENKPLIDFFNTPEIIKVPPLKPVGQLIDLSSPLISLSPEGNKENLDSPLLKF